MNINEAKQILKENDYELSKQEDNVIKITQDIDETICPKCGADGDCYDTDAMNNYEFHYYKCPDCDTKWRVDYKLVSIPECIVVGR